MNPSQRIIDKIRGTTFYKVPWDLLHPGLELAVKREPDNPYDTNAISLWHQRQMLGHIKKEIAAELAPLIDDGSIQIKVRVLEITGTEQPVLFKALEDKKNKGCNIEILVEYNPDYLKQFVE